MADTGVVKSLLQLLENLNDGIDSLEAATQLGVDHQVIVGAVKSLQASGNVSFCVLCMYVSATLLLLMQSMVDCII